MPDDLYDRDVLAWSEQQADLLGRLARGERVNEAVDWPHVIEELEGVGLSELHACESLLRQALVHLLKMWASPEGPTEHWWTETAGFLFDAQRRFAPSMRQRIDLPALYRKAVHQVAGRRSMVRPPAECPYTLDDLLAEDVDVDALLAKLSTVA